MSEPDDDLDESEQHYERGYRAAWVEMLQECLRRLGYDDPETAHVRWVREREEAVGKLREVCEEYGDNDWPDNLHLRDVIEKHLWRHL